MDNTISRQAAIDALFELYEYQRSLDPTEAADLVRQGIYLSEKKIESLPSAQQWIPCKTVNQSYIPQLSGCKMKNYIVACETITGRRVAKTVCIYNGFIRSKVSNVVAYMPLPEPWKGGEDE